MIYYIEKEPLGGLLDEARDGRTQLPDFQRGWVWDDDHVRSLLASISLGYPIGAVMMLRSGGETIRFRQRPLESVPTPVPRAAERLILDGQQRLTSLFQSLSLGKPVQTYSRSGAAGRALAQIRERGYADKYRRVGLPVYLVGVESGREDRDIFGFAVETA